MDDRDRERGRETLKNAILALSVAGCLVLTWYSHFILKTDVVFTHIFYVPIVLAGIWWGRRGVWMALALGAALLGSRFLSGQSSPFLPDFLRSAMFVVIGLLVGTLWNRLRRSQEELRQARDFFIGLANSSNIPIVVWNEFGQITMFNRAMEELTGFRAEQMVGQPIKALFGPESFAAITACLAAGLGSSIEALVRRSNGQESLCLWSPAVIRSGDRKGESATMAQGQDITKRKWAEDLIKRHAEELRSLNIRLTRSEGSLRELNAAKDKFFSIISHDLRSPFMPLLLYSELLHKEADKLSPEKVRELTEALHSNSRRLYNLVENLLEWSRLQTGRMEHNPSLIKVQDLARHAFNLLKDTAERKKVALRSDVSADLTVWADRYHLNCVMQNLVSNGIKFSFPEGAVEVVARKSGERVEILVKDRGVGMPAEALGTIFRIDTYHTTLGTAKEKGSGLGLILCKELLEKNRGSIRVESQEGKGSTFIVTLPANQPTPGGSGTPEPGPA